MRRAERLFVEPSASRFDIVVVLDRGDRATRVLAQRAREHGDVLTKGRNDIPRVMNGLGVAILSTSRGVMTDRKARADGVGGEVLCIVA